MMTSVTTMRQHNLPLFPILLAVCVCGMPFAAGGQTATTKTPLKPKLPVSVAAKPASPTPSVIKAEKGLEIVLPTTLLAPAGLLDTGAPKDAKLAFTLPVGPLPPVTSLAYKPDGSLLAAGVYRTIFLWDMAAGKVANSLMGLSGTVQAVAWSAKGDRLAAASGEPGVSGEIRVYNTADNYRPLPAFKGHTDVVYSLAFSPDGKTLASASHDKTVRTWETETGKPLLTIKLHSDVVYKVRFTPDGIGLVSCGQDRSVKQYETKTGKLIRAFEGHTSGVTALAVRPDGQRFVSADADNRLRWWNTADGNTVNYSNGHGAQVNDIVFSTDGKLVASASADRSVRIWDMNGSGPQKNLTDAPDWNYCVTFTPDAKFVAAGGGDGIVRVWEVATGQYRALLMAAVPPSDSKAGSPLIVNSAVISPQGYIFATPSWSKQLHLKAAESKLKSGEAALLAVVQNEEAVRKTLSGAKTDPPVLPAVTTPPAKPSSQPDPVKKTGKLL